MRAEIQFNDHLYKADLSQPISIAIPLQNRNDNPTCYYTDPVRISPIRTGEFIGSIKEGGPVNHMRIDMAPHGNGTHTECSGHIIDNNKTINNSLKYFFHIAKLQTIDPELVGTDLVITARVINEIDFVSGINALILRTLPNSEAKTSTDYSGKNPTYFSREAMEKIVNAGIEHLVVDLPSVDQEKDGGKLAAHKEFWRNGHRERAGCSITELAYIPNNIVDGLYLLDLQVLRIELDASPSNPILYSLSSI